MAAPIVNTTKLYNIIADTMPTEGRDFTIDVVSTEGKKPSLSIKALTAVGRGFVPVLLERLAKPMAEQGIDLAQEDAINQETLTIARIREQIEREAGAAIQAKLEAVRKDIEAKKAVLAEARKARIDKYGDRDIRTTEESEAMKAVNETARALGRLEEIAERVPDIRKSIEAAARNLAEEDEKNGKPWSVDMDAPVQTLFERQDAIDTFRRKESMIQRLAALAFDTDQVKFQALDATKKFILNKPKA